MLALALHDSFREVGILFFNLKFSEIGSEVFALGGRSFSWGFGGKELVVGSGHDHFYRFGMLGGSHSMLKALHFGSVI
jgi:hypothetical protein